MISQSERDRELYESRVKMRRDMNTALAEREELGEARGLEKGRVEVQARRIQSLQRLLRQEITSTEQLKTRPFPDLENLAVQLENQLSAKVADGS
jgi:flagellar biosynthesis/type III secretory pathway protein FliH